MGSKHMLSQIDSVNHTAICSVCGEVKIYPRERGKFWRCANKGKEKSVKAYYKHREKHAEKRNAANRKRHLWVCYRLTPEDLECIEEFQRNDPNYRVLLGKREGTDHDHKTGLIRGRLEWRINRAYGLIEKVCPDNLAEVLRALANYHEHPPAELALGEKRYGLIGEARYKKTMVYGSPNGPMPFEKRKVIRSKNAKRITKQ